MSRRRPVWSGAALLSLAVACASPAASAARGSSQPLKWRGIVEGAYGPTWTHAERTRVLRWMPVHGFNAYVHAPKDDLYQRTNWRDPYPPAEQHEFDREIHLARRLGVLVNNRQFRAASPLPTR